MFLNNVWKLQKLLASFKNVHGFSKKSSNVWNKVLVFKNVCVFTKIHVFKNFPNIQNMFLLSKIDHKFKKRSHFHKISKFSQTVREFPKKFMVFREKNSNVSNKVLVLINCSKFKKCSHLQKCSLFQKNEKTCSLFQKLFTNSKKCHIFI